MERNYCILPQTSDQALLAQYYSMADVFTICSKKENFPTTCIEAQCCGTPVVGFDTGGTKETSVLSREDFVPYGDLESLKDKIQLRLGQDKDALAKTAYKAYSKEAMAQKYMEEYDRNGRKDRILLIDVNCKHSSTGKIVYDLYTYLRSDGRSASICYGRGEKIEEEGIFKFGSDGETLLHAGLSRLTGYNGCFSPLSTIRLIKAIEAYKPDLIHIHELHAYFVNISPLIQYIKAHHIPLIWTFHCEFMYTGKCGYAYECDNYKKECGNCPAVREYPKSLFFDKTRQMLKTKRELLSDLDFTIITPSQWLADRVKQSFLGNKRIKVIHNGIDTSVFHPVDTVDLRQRIGIPEDQKIVLALAPKIMSERKGGQWVLKLAEKMKDEKIFFVLVGE